MRLASKINVSQVIKKAEFYTDFRTFEILIYSKKNDKENFIRKKMKEILSFLIIHNHKSGWVINFSEKTFSPTFSAYI